MAGLRANALGAALGAALFELLALLVAGSPTAGIEHGAVDFTRVTAHVVSGVGFLGAGVIILDGVNVRGINTAATTWCPAAVGALCGNGYVLEAAIGALAVLVGHLVLRPIAHRIDRQPIDGGSEVEISYRFEAICWAADEERPGARHPGCHRQPASSTSEPCAAKASTSVWTACRSPQSSKSSAAVTSMHGITRCGAVSGVAHPSTKTSGRKARIAMSTGMSHTMPVRHRSTRPTCSPPSSSKSSGRWRTPRWTPPRPSLLIGQPMLASRLRQGIFAAVNQRVSVRYVLQPMNLAESIAYLRHHLELALCRRARRR